MTAHSFAGHCGQLQAIAIEVHNLAAACRVIGREIDHHRDACDAIHGLAAMAERLSADLDVIADAGRKAE